MQVFNNFQLTTYNTFGVTAKAKYFGCFSSVDELDELLEVKEISGRPFILGGGSNILFTRDYDGLVMKNNIPGITISAEDNDFTYVTAGAGESWNDLVSFCVDSNLGGIENLTLIPGNCGAAPMQNIGAYGVELADVFHQLTAFHIKDRSIRTFNQDACKFAYRESVFKKEHKGEFVILGITLKLKKDPVFNLSYDALKRVLNRSNNSELTLKLISDTVADIRRSKLPDPKFIGNAGSFFKNPQVNSELHAHLKSLFPDMISYSFTAGIYKLAAGWLIEQCGYKGKRVGNTGCHKDQALVLVNYGNASGTEIYAFSEQIIDSVFEKFEIVLEREVNVV